MELVRCSDASQLAVGDIGLICGSSVKRLLHVAAINNSDTHYPIVWSKFGSTYELTTTTRGGRWLRHCPDENKDISFIVRFTDEELSSSSVEELQSLAANSAEELFAEARREKTIRMKKIYFFSIVSLIYLISIIVAL